jgi:hypothetical protein
VRGGSAKPKLHGYVIGYEGATTTSINATIEMPATSSYIHWPCLSTDCRAYLLWNGNYVELTFKELKSQYALDAFRTTNADVVEALIWAALLTLVASRRLYNPVWALAPLELLPRYTPMMWSIEFREGASATLGCLLARLGYEQFSEKEWHDVNYRLTVCALTASIRRPPVREVWSR